MVRPLHSVLLSFLLLAPLAAQSEPVASPTQPLERGGSALRRHEEILERVREQRGAVDLVFVGDSITQGWETAGEEVWAEYYGDRRALNLGVSGDRTENVLWRLEHGALDGIAPKVAVVMIGTNNFGHGTHGPEEVLAGVRAVVAKIREKSPETGILLLDIFPRGHRFNGMRGGILQVNQALQRLHDGDRTVCLQIGHVFLTDDGRIERAIMRDFLHLTPAGYRLWAEAIESTLARMLDA